QTCALPISAITSLASMSGNGHTAPRESNAKYPSPRWRALSSALECKLMNPVAICIPGIAVLAGESGKAALIAAAVVCGAVCGVFVGVAVAGFNQYLAPTPIPTAMNNSAIHPWKLNKLV